MGNCLTQSWQVIRATYAFQARTPLELSFEEGDFFHVIDREEDPEFYEACNPALPDARGYVPVALFQVLGRTDAECEPSTKREHGPIPPPIDIPLGSGTGYAMATSSAAASINRPGIPAGAPISNPMAPGHRSTPSLNGPRVYGVVIYDFNAERADELEAKNGEAIIVIAQSNPEWFVAKPIGRLGGPGLIPVSYVQIRDMSTGQALDDPTEAIRQAGVPRVEEWKKMAADYKNSSITLGKFDSSGATSPNAEQQQSQTMQQALERVSLQPNQSQQNGQRGSNSQQGYSQTNQAQSYNRGPGGSVDYGNQQSTTNSYRSQSDQLPHVKEACVELWYSANERDSRNNTMETKFWFIVQTSFQDGQYWALARYYEDFFVCHDRLLKDFPEEAGTVPGKTGQKHRTLPMMPAPLPEGQMLTAEVSELRMGHLDSYVKELLRQPQRISTHEEVRHFFAPRVGDVRSDYSAFKKAMEDTEKRRSKKEPGVPVMIKLNNRGDIRKVATTSDISMEELLFEIRQRYKLDVQIQLDLFYQAKDTQPSLISDADLADALGRAVEDNGGKLLVYVEPV